MVTDLGRTGRDFRRTNRLTTPSLVPPPTPSGSDAASAGPKASFGAACLANVGKGTENQDTFVTSSSTTGSKSFVGVFDGHGESGARMSQFAKNTLTKSLFGKKDLHTDPRSALTEAYRDTQQLMEAKHGPDAHWSGTTAVAAYQHRDRLFVANVGDSRAVLGRCDTARPGAKTNLRAIELSSDHKPDRPDERDRITKQGGLVQQGAFPVLSPMGLRFVRAGPERVMDKNGMGGLAMSRSLGDLSLRPYVCSQPEISERQLKSNDKMLILGTDGVWDQISSQEAVDIAGRHRDPQAAAREITSVAKRRWQEDTQGQMADDITAVVVSLDHGGADKQIQNSQPPTARSTLTAKSWRTQGAYDIDQASVTLPAARGATRARRSASSPLLSSGPILVPPFGGAQAKRRPETFRALRAR